MGEGEFDTNELCVIVYIDDLDRVTIEEGEYEGEAVFRFVPV